MSEIITVTGFNKIELLVHPFFALENVRAKKQAGPLKNMTQEEMLEDYNHLGLIKNWKERILQIKKDPHAILILIGPQEWENQTPRRFFFKGRLTKEKLAKFSTEYQDLLHFAKRELKQRVFYISHTIEGNESTIAKQMWKRKLLPDKNVKLTSYGEYLATTQEGKQLATSATHCVDAMSIEAQNMIEKMQKRIWQGKETKITLEKTHTIQTEGKGKYISLSHHDMQIRQMIKDTIIRGKLRARFLRKRFRLPKGFNTREQAKIHTDAYRGRK